MLPWSDLSSAHRAFLDAIRTGKEQEYEILNEYRLLTLDPIALSVFSAVHKRNFKDGQVVVKLTGSQREIELFEYLNTHGGPEKHVVEWRTFGREEFGDAGSCDAIVMEQGKSLDIVFANASADDMKLPKFGCVDQLIRAVRFLHGHGFIHGNICLGNAARFGDLGQTKLIGFSHTTKRNEPLLAHARSSIDSCPPEMAHFLLGLGPKPVATASYDIYCLAVMVLKLFLPGLRLVEFDNLDDEAIVRKIAACNFSLDESIQASSLRKPQKQLLMKCLAANSFARGSLKDLEDILPKNDTNMMTIRDVHNSLGALQVTVVHLDKFVVPCMWNLERADGNSFVEGMERLIGRMRFRVTFLCEMRDDDHPCDMVTDRMPDDENLVVKVDSQFLRDALPVLKAMTTGFRLLGLLDKGSSIVKEWLDWEKMETAKHAVDAIENMLGKVEQLDLEAKLKTIVNDIANKHLDPSEAEGPTQVALQAYRDDDATYERLKKLLDSVGYNYRNHVVGGLTKRVVRHDHPNPKLRGQVRWVCANHKEHRKAEFQH
ncbi:Aste57867_81 [Aphanomyces stellatus]|uniref:Aste57867_81 protein n=1 Tax=Aphanomyces stellatus TaxID=120398 RepID=A0A485K2U5_9STRA|nr:hypothetical protein As57867_000081 [Aphanomyces stellatus]VFT77307.1 Aste57867_81 [Aphanomyces stellatus]